MGFAFGFELELERRGGGIKNKIRSLARASLENSLGIAQTGSRQTRLASTSQWVFRNHLEHRAQNCTRFCVWTTPYIFEFRASYRLQVILPEGRML
jgi:hypothetical protein